MHVIRNVRGKDLKKKRNLFRLLFKIYVTPVNGNAVNNLLKN